jgi:CheY-like chemotaxis protein
MISPTSTRILIADDDADDLELFTEAITKMHSETEVKTFLSGTAALRHLELCPDEELPHFIVLDYNIPDINGSEILNQILYSRKVQHIPVFIWSTSNSPHLRNECLGRGAKAFFVKPVLYNDMLQMAQQLIHMAGLRVVSPTR